MSRHHRNIRLSRIRQLSAICRRCKHQRVLYPGNYIERFGADCPAIEMREHLRCSSCRGRMANLHKSAR
jgi:hypothetical protein